MKQIAINGKAYFTALYKLRDCGLPSHYNEECRKVFISVHNGDAQFSATNGASGFKIIVPFSGSLNKGGDVEDFEGFIEPVMPAFNPFKHKAPSVVTVSLEANVLTVVCADKGCKLSFNWPQSRKPAHVLDTALAIAARVEDRTIVLSPDLLLQLAKACKGAQSIALHFSGPTDAIRVTGAV